MAEGVAGAEDPRPAGVEGFVVNVVDLRRQLGEQLPVRRSAPSPGLALTGVAVPEGADIDVDLVLESISGGVSVGGTIGATWTGECRRCLDAVAGRVSVEVHELYQDVPVPDETYPIDGDVIDLGPMIRDVTLLTLPLAPLCRPDCPGPVPEVFPVVVEGDEPAEPRDPRWAALDALRDDLEGGVAAD